MTVSGPRSSQLRRSFSVACSWPACKAWSDSWRWSLFHIMIVGNGCYLCPEWLWYWYCRLRCRWNTACRQRWWARLQWQAGRIEFRFHQCCTSCGSPCSRPPWGQWRPWLSVCRWRTASPAACSSLCHHSCGLWPSKSPGFQLWKSATGTSNCQCPRCCVLLWAWGWGTCCQYCLSAAWSGWNCSSGNQKYSNVWCCFSGNWGLCSFQRRWCLRICDCWGKSALCPATLTSGRGSGYATPRQWNPGWWARNHRRSRRRWQ